MIMIMGVLLRNTFGPILWISRRSCYRLAVSCWVRVRTPRRSGPPPPRRVGQRALYGRSTGATHCLPDLRQLHFCVEIGSLSIDAGFSAGARAVAATKCSRGFGSDAAVPGISVAAGFTNTASRSLRPVRQLRHCFCFCFFGPVPTQFQALRHPTRAACCGLLGARAHCVRIGACNPTLCPIRGLQAPRT